MPNRKKKGCDSSVRLFGAAEALSGNHVLENNTAKGIRWHGGPCRKTCQAARSLFLMWLHNGLARWLRFGEALVVLLDGAVFCCCRRQLLAQLQPAHWSIGVPLGTPVAQPAPVIPEYILSADNS